MSYIAASHPYYISSDFAEATAKIEHYFFTYQPNNSMSETRLAIAQQINLKFERLIFAQQIHSAKVAVINESNYKNKIQADAMVSNNSGFGLAIITADCTPILLADSHKNVIGAIHAGWRGAIAGIIETTIEQMLLLGAKKENITAIIGPTISQKNYEVDAEFKQNFLAQNENNTKYFIPKSNKYLFDLERYNLDCLKHAQIKAFSLQLCTYENAEHFSSYRRATHLGTENTGRQLSVISLK
ncbi:peptidoglycan editing factor PgeF [Bartonella sp. TP]|uniref:peptidoglycan editing factor PgeF n=1 Tax=Bartonella sp. TP TaxID=3057550 RepID=UPI0025B143FA|nr:peptidoglycan editing factor PgeF [Bartonella sp. TP]MDN5249699.1 peptidoglycan editing factor PgeF [Alphaproteobacteria bacterium]WJW79722.1 peptidoglycan editing factor PgeF [Bartonella sp. TP]